MEQIWARSGNNTEQKLKAMQDLDISFKEYKLNSVGKEIKRTEGLLEEDNNWSAAEEDRRRFRELEK